MWRSRACVLAARTAPRAPHSSSLLKWRAFSSAATEAERCMEADTYMAKTRNIGISAHIDSGKTTLTERILYYTGRIRSIHDVRGKDGVGAKMDHMDLEREKGITIQSAATFCKWGDHHVNIIDTPGHVDFTIEVERALRVLDGAILVLCGVSGVQSQSLTVDRQMKRYGVPRLAFINKLDRTGSNPNRVIKDLREQLHLNAAAVQLPIGLEGNHVGVVDVVSRCCYINQGQRGETVESKSVPEDMVDQVEAARLKLVECVADVDDEVAELFLMEEEISEGVLQAAIRRATIALKLVPVFMGSAFKNKGVQPLLDGVVHYLPSPPEVPNYALDTREKEQKVAVSCSEEAPTLALAFKLEDGRFGQLTYMRIYQGKICRGDQLFNLRTGKRTKIPRLVRMHSSEMEEVAEAGAGDVVGIFGVECSSMDTFTDGTHHLAMSSMFVPEPVMSLAIKPKKSADPNFFKALQRFSKEDPTLRVHTEEKTGQTIISGMGELHLEVYVERLKREYEVVCEVGQPSVNYMETVRKKTNFEYLHKKQSGGAGQYAKVIGFLEPLEEDYRDSSGEGVIFEFRNDLVGMNIPPEYVTACEKGAEDARHKGALIGAEVVQGMRVVLTDGQAHAVDSSELAFRTAMAAAVRTAMPAAQATVLEPIMSVEVLAPQEFQGSVVAGLNKRTGIIQSSEFSEDGGTVVVKADVPLAQMFGYSTELRSSTQGKGEFSMEYKQHIGVTRDRQEALAAAYQEE
ncbi:unnamed protein product [Chrysoparadoxa australica]